MAAGAAPTGSASVADGRTLVPHDAYRRSGMAYQSGGGHLLGICFNADLPDRCDAGRALASVSRRAFGCQLPADVWRRTYCGAGVYLERFAVVQLGRVGSVCRRFAADCTACLSDDALGQEGRTAGTRTLPADNRLCTRS